MPEAHVKPCYMLETPKAQGATYATILEDVTMDNQQATLIELAWLGGIIDGEGYIGIQYCKTRQNKISTTSEVRITNTDEEIILKAQKIYQKIGVNPHLRFSKWHSKHRVCSKIIYYLAIHRLNLTAKSLIPVIPFLTGSKKERAELVLEFCQSRLSHGFGRMHPFTKREIDIIESCITKQKRGASETIRKAQLEQSKIYELQRVKSIQRKIEYNKKWKKDNHNEVMEQQRMRRTFARNQFCSSVVDDDIVQPFAKA